MNTKNKNKFSNEWLKQGYFHNIFGRKYHMVFINRRIFDEQHCYIILHYYPQYLLNIIRD